MCNSSPKPKPPAPAPAPPPVLEQAAPATSDDDRSYKKAKGFSAYKVSKENTRGRSYTTQLGGIPRKKGVK